VKLCLLSIGKEGVSDYLGRSSWLRCAPSLAVPEDDVEDHQELAHGRGERDLLGFAGRATKRR
jgi:hypothetical protein